MSVLSVAGSPRFRVYELDLGLAEEEETLAAARGRLAEDEERGLQGEHGTARGQSRHEWGDPGDLPWLVGVKAIDAVHTEGAAAVVLGERKNEDEGRRKKREGEKKANRHVGPTLTCGTHYHVCKTIVKTS